MGWLTKPVDKTPQLKERKGSKTTTTQQHKRGRGKTTTTHDAESGVTRQTTRWSLRDLLG